MWSTIIRFLFSLLMLKSRDHFPAQLTPVFDKTAVLIIIIIQTADNLNYLFPTYHSSQNYSFIKQTSFELAVQTIYLSSTHALYLQNVNTDVHYVLLKYRPVLCRCWLFALLRFISTIIQMRCVCLSLNHAKTAGRKLLILCTKMVGIPRSNIRPGRFDLCSPFRDGLSQIEQSQKLYLFNHLELSVCYHGIQINN